MKAHLPLSTSFRKTQDAPPATPHKRRVSSLHGGRFRSGLLSLITATLVTSALPLQAQIFARFTDGNTTEAEDGYHGKAGNGWTEPWKGTGAVGSVTVVNEGTLWGDSNRLKVTPSHDATGTRINIGRSYDSIYEDFDATKPVTITFQFSFDDLGSFLSTPRNAIFIGENGTNSGSPTSSTSWFIEGFGGTNHSETPGGGNNANARQGQWNIGDGKGGHAPTGILLEEGVLYTFTLSITPSTGEGIDSTYTAFLTNGTESFQSGVLKFRSEQELARVLVFGEDYKPGEGATYSFGNIAISQIPEPSSAALLLVPLVGIGVAIYRRQR